MKQLPNRKSELIRLAVADLEKCEADPKYKIDMKTWAYINSDGTCLVCLAGAVMAQEFDYVRLTSAERSNHFEDFYPTYDFLDEIRKYNIYDPRITKRLNNEIPTTDERKLYHEDPEVFKKNMLRIADWFEEIGE